MERWLTTDENEEAVSALEFLAEIAPDVTDDIYRWKWVILATHNALQGFMVTALRHTDGSGPIPDKLFVAMRSAEKAGTRPPEVQLDNFLDLYRKIKNEKRMHQNMLSKRFVPGGTQSRSVCTLNSLRNEFIHFTPKGWSLEITGLPTICLDCLKIVGFLAEESNNILWHKAAHRDRTLVAMTTAETFLLPLQHEFETVA